MTEQIPISDEELSDLLLKAGMAPEDIEANREAFPLAKVVLSTVAKMFINRVAARLIAEAMK